MSSVHTVVLAGQWGYLINAQTATVREDDRLRQKDMSMQLLEEYMGRMIKRLRGQGKRVVPVEPPPSGGFSIARCVERDRAGKFSFGAPPDCRVPLEIFYEVVREEREVLGRVGKNHDVSVFSFEPHLCGGEACQVTLGEEIVYRDAGHFSYERSVAVAEQYDLAKHLNQVAK